MISPKSWIPLLVVAGLSLQAYSATSPASDRPAGSPLWLGYQSLAPDLQKPWSAVVQQVYCPGSSDILRNARNGLIAASAKMTNRKVVEAGSIEEDGTVLLGTGAQLQQMIPAQLAEKAGALRDGGFLIESTILQGKKCTVILGKDEPGVLYGTFHFLRLMQTGAPSASLRISSEPAIDLRMLNHWDNIFNDRDKTPLEYLLWFHRVPWDAKLSTGRTLWEELEFRYNRGVTSVDQMAETWQSLQGKVTPEIHASVTKKLQEKKPSPANGTIPASATSPLWPSL